MSSAFWQTLRQPPQFNPGKTATDRAREYVRTWMYRCYSNGIPDEVPIRVEASGRAPSYRALAIAILKNDLHFYSLGFSRPDWDSQLEAVERGRLANGLLRMKAKQIGLFNDLSD